MTEARRTSLPAVGVFLAVLLALTMLLSLASGAFRISLPDLLGIIGDGPRRDSTDIVAHNVFWQVRLPRVILAMVVGSSLAVAGVIMQGIFRNPLAEPATVGVSAGAAVGAVIAIIVGLNSLPLGVQIAAFVGGTLSTALVYVLSRYEGKTEVVTLILTGIAINAFAGAVIGFAVFVADDDEIRSVTFWSLGTLGLATWKAVGAVIPLAVIGMLVSARFSRVLDTLALGDRSAAHLGVRVERVRLQAIAVVGLLASSAVAATGMIAFVGLLVPHIMRIVLGPRHQHLLWTAALLGASVTLLADLAARTLLSPAELPLGVVTALIGAPFFLLLLRSTRRSQGGWA
jgi:iron complex transport system permease protein